MFLGFIGAVADLIPVAILFGAISTLFGFLTIVPLAGVAVFTFVYLLKSESVEDWFD